MKILIENIRDIILDNDFMNLRKPLEELTNKKAVSFSFDPAPHYRIKDREKTYIIVNKKYADKSEYIIGDIALGIDGVI